MYASTRRLGTSLLVGLLCASPSVDAQDWPHWRGPAYNGSTKARGLPTLFDQKKHVRWAALLPGPGACTPIVVGDRIFLSSVDTKRKQLVAMCVNRKDGAILWMNDVGDGKETFKDRGSNYASPSPTTDGKTVIFFFSNGTLVACDYEGKQLWRRNVQEDYGEFAFQWTFSASPTFWEGKVFLPVLQRDKPVARRRGRRGASRQESSEEARAIESFLLALDPKTGKTLYKHVRPSQARVESLESYATLIPFVGKAGRKELLCVGGDVITGHDPATGKELWRWGTWNEGHREIWWRVVPSVVIGGGLALVCAPKRAPVYAVRLGGEGRLGADALAWKSGGRPNPVSSDVPTPAFHEGHFYVLSDVRSALSKVAATDGTVVWTKELPRDYKWRASPTVADGRVWLMNHNGEVFVIGTEKGDILHRVQMGKDDDDQIRSTIVVAHDSLFIRTHTRLYCIGG